MTAGALVTKSREQLGTRGTCDFREGLGLGERAGWAVLFCQKEI